MLKRAFGTTQYALLLLKLAGARVFFRQLRRQLCSIVTFIGLERNLEADNVPLPARIEYTVRLATAKDMEDIFQRAKTESKESTHELLHRWWFYESGFHNCYVARTVTTGEICYIQWILSPDDGKVVSQMFRSKFPTLKKDDILLAKAYTFEKYRGNRLMPSVAVKSPEVARNDRFKRMIAYVDQNNIASLKALERAGFRKFEEMHELRLFFYTTRKYKNV